MKYNLTSHWVNNINDFMKFIEVIDRIDCKLLRRLFEQTNKASGTPQEPMDWKGPSKWIEELYKKKILDENTKLLAEKIFKNGLNPKWWNYEIAQLALRHDLLERKSGKYISTEKGKKFANKDRKILDEYLFENGVYKVLEFLNEDTGVGKSELIETWKAWIQSNEIGRRVESKTLLTEGVLSRIDNVLIPLGYAQKEGIPRRYFITERGVKKIEEIIIGDKDEAKHNIAVNNILDIGKNLGYQIQKFPKLRDFLPKEKLIEPRSKIYNKELDGIWKTNLPIVGEIKIPIEVQEKGSIPDLLSRLRIVAPFSHFMIIVSDENQIKEISEFIKATGEEKIFSDKIIYLTFRELTEIRSQVINIGKKLKPSFIEEEIVEKSREIE